MENFIVSARKYRPARFEDVIGQPQVTQTLKNAIRSNQLAQAFLFCGPRGVGKTTCARILAKVINCENITKEIEACNECDSCKSFNENASFNVHELDAASNNSIEDIRTLIEQVRYAPQEGKKKIYIIDEVHMLSQQAFNAFLKTLEEPPQYAIFILATTEKHKIIPTILSRCQIFDFNRIKMEDAAAYLKNIAAKERIEAEEDALHLIAQKADGAMRDALSMFDRLSVFSNNKITYADAIENLNILDYDYFFSLVDAFLAEDVSNVLLTYDQILQKGFEGDNFIQGLAEHLRNLMVCKDASTVQLMQVSENLKQRYLSQALYIPLAFIINALNILQEADGRYKLARNKRLLLEMTLIKLSYLNKAVKLAAENSNEDQEVKKKVVPSFKVKSQEVSANQNIKEPVRIETPVANVTVEKAVVRETVTVVEEANPVLEVASKSVTGNKLSDLSQFRKSVLKQEEKADDVEVEKEKFSIETAQLLNASLFYEALLKLDTYLEQNKKYLLRNPLQMFPPQLVEGKRIEIVTSAEMTYKLLMSENDFIADYFKKYLKADKLWLEIKWNKEIAKQEVVSKPYTAAERYKYLLAKNPKLQDFKDKLKLDIE